MRSKFFLLIALAGFWSSSSLASFDLSPIISSVAPTGPAATTAFILTNTDDTKTPVQIGIFVRNPDAAGIEKYEETKDIGDMFQIYPTQMILNPHEKRTVRVTYVGDPKISRELSFRVIAEEFPINVSDPKRVKDRAVASISIASKYIGSLYVTPGGAKPDINIDATLNSGKTGNEMVLMVENKGSQHLILKSPKFKVVSLQNNAAVELSKDDFPGVGGQNILAGKTRKYVVPWPKNVPVGPVKVTVEVAKQQ
jgi:fimbrial chaperone protein